MGSRACLTHRVIIWAVVNAQSEQAIELFPTRDEAEEMLAVVLAAEPDWRGVLHRLG